MITTMKPYRRLLTAVSALSLVLCMGTVALWVRSFWVCDQFICDVHGAPGARVSAGDEHFDFIGTEPGRFYVGSGATPYYGKMIGVPLAPRGWHHEAQPSADY